jgi:1-acyl-sn-glycerol-3-phosphate acyltransferase
VPIAIFGTRDMLGAGRKLPRPGPIRVDILPAILPDDPDYGDHHSLAETARQRILSVLDEPDLLATLG